MRTYIVILSDVNETADVNFFEFINKNKFDYWRYTALNWILLTPDSVSTNSLIASLAPVYENMFFTVLEIDIKDVGGIFPSKKSENLGTWSPFLWFYEIKSPSFVPRWEKDKIKSG